MPKIQHMVVIKVREEVTDAQLEEAFTELYALQDVIDGIEYMKGGPYSSHEGLNGGYTHGFLVTFTSPEARDAYLPHPEHERVKAMIIPLVEGVVAFDFED